MKKLRRMIFLLAMALVAVVMCMHYLSDLIDDFEIKEALTGTSENSQEGGVTVSAPDGE